MTLIKMYIPLLYEIIMCVCVIPCVNWLYCPMFDNIYTSYKPSTVHVNGHADDRKKEGA